MSILTIEVERKSYIKEVDSVITHIESILPSERELFLGGDFNFTIGERQPGEFQVTEKAERAVIQRMADLGVSSSGNFKADPSESKSKRRGKT